MTKDAILRCVENGDAADIARIYNYYVTETTVSFEVEPVSVEQMLCRIKGISSKFPYIVIEEQGRVVGYCYVHQWKERAAYSKTLELTIYLDPECRHKGYGAKLIEYMTEICRNMNICHSLIACITEENHDSLAFHQAMGFERVSHFKKVGYKFGKWLDVVDMQLML